MSVIAFLKHEDEEKRNGCGLYLLYKITRDF